MSNDAMKALTKFHYSSTWLAFSLLFVLLIGISALYLSMGSISISWLSPLSEIQSQVLWQLRLPRLLAAILLGASLAVSGATLQILLSNPLAEPGIIGISGGSSLTMVIGLFFVPIFMTPVGIMLASILGALVFTLGMVMIAQWLQLTTTRMLLLGVAFSILTSALITWSFYFSDNFNLRILMYWLMGSLSGVSWLQVYLAVFVVPCLIFLCFKSRTLDYLLLGEEQAKQLGIDVFALRWKLIICIAVLIGCSVAIGGVISFIGLIIPHLIRLLWGVENRYLLPISAVSGAILLVIADLLARVSYAHAELPLGVVTTTLGAPIFIWILLKTHAQD